MNISGSDTSCYTNNLSPGLSLQMYSITDQDHHHPHDDHDHVADHHVSSNSQDHLQPNNSTASSLLYSLSILKDKIQQLQTLVAVLFSPPPADPSSGTSVAIASMSMHGAIQDIIMTSSSMLLNFQHMGLASTSGNPTTNPPHHDNNNNNSNIPHQNTGNALSSSRSLGQQGLIYPGASDHHQTVLEWYGSSNDDDQNFNNNSTTTCTTYSNKDQIRAEENMFPLALGSEKKDGKGGVSAPKNFDIIEFDAADLLAKYTHYCQVCGKGFKRDANLRMHMRAHGDQYKTSSALSNPMKKINNTNDLMGMNKSDFSTRLPKKYSCPQEGCRWNQRHAKFQPLKSMICVKNHYKRSHCPKMYVCKKCNRKQFSVLSDLRTHEKHCGDLKWQCSCGTTFSRKDKLMGHVSLFVGHTPLFMNTTSSSSPTTNINNNNNKKIESQLVSQVPLDSIVKMME